MFQRILSILILMIWQQSLFAVNWPQLEKSEKQQCSENIVEKILHVAESAFHSSSEKLSSISKTQLGDELKLLIRAKGIGEDSRLKVFDKTFEIIDGNKAEKGVGWHHNEVESFRFAVYWQRKATNGFRFVLCADKVGWRGNMYSLFSIPESLSQEEFISKKDSIKPIIANSWCLPLIIQHLPSQQIVAVNVGNSFDVLADWKVYLAYHGAAPCCVVHFRPSMEASWNLLPTEVGQLAQLLDETLGDGRDEGTLQSTGHLRINAARTWANVALRPWAVNNAANTRKEVDLGLSEWSHKSKKFLVLYQKINEQYPKAEQALAQYYQDQLQLTAEKAKRLASYILDVAYRNNFIFPRKKSKENNPTAVNPWNE